MIRDFEPEDIFDIEDIHDKSCTYPMPSYSSPVNICKKTILIDDKIVGSCFVHLTAEIGLILDKDLSTITRAKIIKELFEQLLKETDQTDLEDYHIYVVPESDENYADFLGKHFDFQRDKGISLTRFKNNEQSKRESGAGLSQELNDGGKDDNGSGNSSVGRECTELVQSGQFDFRFD